MAYPHHRGRHCQQIVHVGLGVGGPGHRHRRSRSCPCSTCRISRRSNTTASSSIKMIDQPNSKKQATTGTMTNGSSACSNKPRRLHQILTRAYLPPNHAAARNKIVSPPPDHENESLTPNVVSPEESVAYLGADYPLPSPSPSRIIKIPREDNNDIENRAYEQSECDAATWKMCKLMNFLVVRLRRASRSLHMTHIYLLYDCTDLLSLLEPCASISSHNIVNSHIVTLKIYSL